MKGEVFTDAEKSYHETRLNSGIPPPSLHNRSGSGSRYQQRHERRDRRYDPYKKSTHSSVQTMLPKKKLSSQISDSRTQTPRISQNFEQPRKVGSKVDIHMNTEFLVCGNEQGSRRLRLEELVGSIQASDALLDYDFLSSADLINRAIVLREKSRTVSPEAWSLARARSNPFEWVGKSIFMNRAATKLAAMDAAFGLTAIQGDKPLSFADLCGGPGGFTEYLLWRLHNQGRSGHGYGITLKVSSGQGEVNWKLGKYNSDFTHINGSDGTGDLYKEANIKKFATIVLERTRKVGVDLVLADGGFDFSKKTEPEEHQAKRLLLCEIITMLTCLRQGGVFVCKYFEMIEEFTADMIWLLYQLFDKICITKPPTSRPANSECFVICKGLRYFRPTQLVERLLSLNAQLASGDIGKFIARTKLEGDEEFLDYLKKRNLKFVLKQIESLQLIDEYLEEPNRAPLYEQEQVKRRCLFEWNLPLSAE